MRWLLPTFLLFSFSLQAQEVLPALANVREGKTFYSSIIQRKTLKTALKKIANFEAVEIFSDAVSKQNSKKFCSYSLNSDIQKVLTERAIKINYKGFVYLLRDENQIDDVVVKILLQAHKVKTTNLIQKDEEHIFFPADNESTKAKLDLIASFEDRFAKNTCFDEAFRAFYSELSKLDKDLESYQVEALIYKAFLEGRISQSTYINLEQGRLNEVQDTVLTLSSYQQKVQSLRTQYPLRDLTEKSDFVTSKVKKSKSSQRQRLFENYSELQIMMMGNVIKKLRERLEYDAVEISGFREGVLQEVIPLDPMERFRFAIKILRKEMSLLSVNSLFNGRSPSYIDLMVASYEIGVIPQSELEAVASLEEIWNPKKTFWEKAGVWIRVFSSVATIAIPPPYGFIPALAIVVIEATIGKKKQTNQNDPTVLF